MCYLLKSVIIIKLLFYFNNLSILISLYWSTILLVYSKLNKYRLYKIINIFLQTKGGREGAG